MKLVLASASPWRKELLRWLMVPFVVKVSGVEEDLTVFDEPDEAVSVLAYDKAAAVFGELWEKLPFGGEEVEGLVVLAADTLIWINDRFIGKPRNRHEAFEIISTLQGKTHEVWTGVSLVTDTGERRTETEMTRVTLRPMVEAEIEEYLQTKEWEGKAGGYQIQGAIRPFVTDIEGSTTNVIGLPILPTVQMLEETGIRVPVNPQTVIEQHLGCIS